MGAAFPQRNLSESVAFMKKEMSTENLKNIFKSRHFICIILTAIVLLTAAMELFVSNDKIDQHMLAVNITNTTCTKSVHITRKIFFHECLKDNQTIYDLRYFWADENNELHASIIGVQISAIEYKKLCQMCVE